MINGTEDDDNANFNIDAGTLRADNASILTPGNYSVRIQTTDDKGGNYAKSFSITVNDDLSPTFQNSTPSVSGTTMSQTTLSIQLDEIGTAYYVVVADGDGAPSLTQHPTPGLAKASFF